MFPYLVCFTCSCMLLYGIRNTEKTSGKFIVISIIALALPCFLAGVRAPEIGTDVKGYIYPLFQAAQRADSIADYYQSSWWASYRRTYVSDYEIGFSFLFFVLQRCFNSVPVILFAIQCIIIIPIYLALVKYVKKEYAWFGMLIYYFMFYNVGLNTMRQWIAMALLFYAFHFLEEKKYVNYFCGVLVSFLFHKSALIGFVFAALEIFVSSKLMRNSLRVRGVVFSSAKLRAFAIFCAMSFVLFANEIIVVILNIIGLGGYSHYFAGDTRVMLSQIIVRLPLIVFLWMNRKVACTQKPGVKLATVLIICDVVFANLSSVNEYAWRTGAWFMSYYIYLCPLVMADAKKKYRKLYCLFFVMYMVAYWLFYFVYKGTHATVPYVSIF